ncbi:hypothetical protein [Tautonia plasticadhaerens]|uniref:Uncharacterized protein n=1 Tax=Tautonia plasticadhaerens TaxID=2527974 RepID=A0A518HB59_9BACT|nr:hypothetical protein [Tautonia plasticadhaerens]QDV38094.1 hypothetical protein ElP_60430 [Tautonia plasticadhaerens]
MQIQAIRSMLSRRPFVPFALHLADGRVIPIRHPDMLVISPNGATAETFVNYETREVIPLDRVASLDTPGAGSPGGGPRP